MSGMYASLCARARTDGTVQSQKNEGGEIICDNYGWITSLALDPIEKKPLYDFHPGSMILSVGSYGCNLRCPFCQNHEISMTDGKDLGAENVSSRQLADLALMWKEQNKEGNIGVAYTYNEPLVGWEFVRDTARLVREYGMFNVLVTNGTASKEVLEELLPWIDAMNIDLKGFREEYYQKLGGDLETVKAFIMRAAGELSCGTDDSDCAGGKRFSRGHGNAGQMDCQLTSVNPSPYHPLFPRYRMRDREATDVEQLYRLAGMAGKYLEKVYVGNV